MFSHGAVCKLLAETLFYKPQIPMTVPFETPILFLIFNRPNTTHEVFGQIRKLSPKRLYIASDGPRADVAGEKEKCELTRKIVADIDWHCEVKTLYRDENLGCGLAVSSAITWFFDQVEEGIILEDDCFPDLSFFPYCEELLSKYRHTERIKLISGNNFQGGKTWGTGSYYFSQYPEIWGWASWRRVWKEYDYEIRDLAQTFASDHTAKAYSSNTEKEYWYSKFQLTVDGLADTWDYQLTYAILKNKGLAISPQVNLVKNIGIEENATHHSLKDSFKNLTLNSIRFPLAHPEIIPNKKADARSFDRIYKHSFSRMFRLLRENGIINFFRYYLKQRAAKK